MGRPAHTGPPYPSLTWRLVVFCAAVLAAAFVTIPAHAQVPPPDIASYTISATYTPDTHRISAQEIVTYVNRTDAPIPDLVFHLYLNAFRSTETLWMQEAGPQHRGFSYSAANPGWIEIDEIQLDDSTALTLEDVDSDRTLVRAALPKPVPPGESVRVELAFEAQLPKVFARTGWADGGDFVMAGQWFPKLGVWEDGAWNAYPFHANSEFYADFGTYNVDLTVPEGWDVGATGVRLADGASEDNVAGMVTYSYQADHVIDFAWSASSEFATLRETAGGVEATVYYPVGRRGAADRVLAATLEGLDLYDGWYGPYGRGLYPRLTVILVPPDAAGAGGMEYPTLFTVGATASAASPRCVRLLEAETVHELAHQWFQSMVATNEAEAPWLDEGFTDYTTARAMAKLAGGEVVTCGGWTLSYLGMQRLIYATMPRTSMAGKAWDFGAEYAIATYAKPVVALSTLERAVGEPAMSDFLRTYVDTYAFGHPTGDDVREVMAETLGEQTATWFFDEVVDGAATLDGQVGDVEPGAVELIRTGDLCLPVNVEVRSQGIVTTQTWPCDGPLEAGDQSWRRVDADPEHIALIDLNLANNAVSRRPDWQSWLGALARLTRALQSLSRGGW